MPVRISSRLLFLFLLAVAGCHPWYAQADRMESDSYVIQFGNFNMTSGEQAGDSYNLTNTTGQTAAGPFGAYGSSNYFLGSGFQYIYQIQDFSFSISKTAIDFGLLTPGDHATDSHTLTVTTRGAGGYTVYARELRPLTHSDGSATIPDTTCDASDCNYTTAGSWIDENVPGFGYSMSGDDIPAAFVPANYFKAFANQAVGNDLQPVMQSSNIATQRQATVTYKAGISGSQTAGNYETGIMFVAVPGY